MDLATLRVEFTDLHSKATAIIEKATTENRDLTEAEKTESDTQFARMEQIRKIEANNAKLAEFAFTNKTDKVELPTLPSGKAEADQIEIRVGHTFDAASLQANRELFVKAANNWARTGVMDHRFATITTATQNGILLPVSVGTPIVPIAINAYRAAHALYNIQPVKTDNTETLNLPVMDATAGGPVSQTANTETESEPGLTNSIVLNAIPYQSDSTWYSNTQLLSVSFDLFAATLPSLEYQKELGLENTITSQIVADSNITQTVTTANNTSTGTFTFNNLVSLNRAFAKKFDQLKVIMLSQSAYTVAEGLTDTVGRPILTADAQNQELKRFNGTPVLRSDYFQATGTAGNVIGAVISLMGFRLRDAGPERIARYVNFPNRPDQTGFNLFANHGFGYDVQAVAKLVNHA